MGKWEKCEDEMKREVKCVDENERSVGQIRGTERVVLISVEFLNSRLSTQNLREATSRLKESLHSCLAPSLTLTKIFYSMLHL